MRQAKSGVGDRRCRKCITREFDYERELYRGRELDALRDRGYTVNALCHMWTRNSRMIGVRRNAAGVSVAAMDFHSFHRISTGEMSLSLL